MKIPVNGPTDNVFDEVGGLPWFTALVERFYEGVATDAVLRPLYPDDLTESIAPTAGFLAQYWGGGMSYYSEQKGHPRLRMRHAHVAIGPAERDAWLHHMVAAVRAGGLAPQTEARMIEYFEMAANAMINVAPPEGDA